uniref:Uncharacterized protein n=1 Tax=Panagrolaimus davidi TaxID=227884 RepID=A0A914PVK7_9BILA
MLTFNTDGMILQRYAFPPPVMYYIMNNVKSVHLIKLYQCCKFFYSKFRRNIIRHLVVVDDDGPEILNPTITIIRASNTALKKLADFWISDSFTLIATYNVQNTLPTFSHCTIKKLELCDYIKHGEFLMLTEAGTIEELMIKGVFADDGIAFIPIEDIIVEVPNTKSITISESVVSPTTFSSLISLKHRAKFSNLVLKNMTNAILFENNLMVDFVLKNADIVCDVLISFQLNPGINDLLREHNFLKNLLSFNFNYLIALHLQKRKMKLPKRKMKFFKRSVSV